MKCKCGSYAINPHLHGRDGSRNDLCDVCYWRNKAESFQKETEGNQPMEGVFVIPGSFKIEWEDEDHVRVTKHWKDFDEVAILCGGDFETILGTLFTGVKVSRVHKEKKTDFIQYIVNNKGIDNCDQVKAFIGYQPECSLCGGSGEYETEYGPKGCNPCSSRLVPFVDHTGKMVYADWGDTIERQENGLRLIPGSK